jgi:hypothetical protein
LELKVPRKLPAFAGNGRGPGSVAVTVGVRPTLVRKDEGAVGFDAFAPFGKYAVAAVHTASSRTIGRTTRIHFPLSA